jgi:predicted ATPase with chaperone activity
LANEKIANIDLNDALFVDELALDGSIRPANGILPIVLFAEKHNFNGKSE